MLSKIYAPALTSFDGDLIEIECDMANSLPGLVVVGLADKTVAESRERIRSAIKNSGFSMPPKKITLNLAPADIPKDGTGYDLGMTIAILCASAQLKSDIVTQSMFLGELSLNGSLRPVRGAILAALLAKRTNLKNLFVPADNAREAAAVSGINIFGVHNLKELVHHLSGRELLSVVNKTSSRTTKSAARTDKYSDFAEIIGQPRAKRAAEIAAAGGHNLLLSGSPGSGKTMIANAIRGILPELDATEIIETTKIHSLAGTNNNSLISTRPFRAPHHTASGAAMTGGGSSPRPGEISLSHNGILFLDEISEFSRAALEALRQPMEDGFVTISRATGSTRFPAVFMLVATRNPCRCGFAGSNQCDCAPGEIARYSRKLSGPLLDRIDLSISMQPTNKESLLTAKQEESSAQIYSRVRSARIIQAARFKKSNAARLNSQMAAGQLALHCRLKGDVETVARQALQHLNISARGYSKVLKIARTIADLDQSPDIQLQHFSEAVSYRI